MRLRFFSCRLSLAALVFLTVPICAQDNAPTGTFPFATLGSDSDNSSYVDLFAGDDMLPYTDDDFELPERGNVGGTWGFAHHDLNSDGAISDDEHIFVIIRRGDDDAWEFSANSRPEYGVIYESEDWNDYHDARNEGPSSCCVGDLDAEGNDFEHNDRRPWCGESNAYLYNNASANQHGKGKPKYYFENINPGSAPAADEPFVYDEVEGFLKPLNFQHNMDDPATKFNERGDCRRDYFRTFDAVTRGYLLPVDDLDDLEDGSLPTLFGWETVDLAAYLRDTIAPKLQESGLSIYGDAFDPALLLPPTHIMLAQIEVPIVVNVNDTCGNGVEQAQLMADYWGIPAKGATYRVSHILGFNADFFTDFYGKDVRTWAHESDDGTTRNAWLYDLFFRDDASHLGKYEVTGDAWTIESDPTFEIIDFTNNKVLINRGEGSIRAPLPRALGTDELPLEVVVDLGDGDIGPPLEGGGGGLGVHQIILEHEGSVVAYAEISADGSSVNLGGELNAGRARNPTKSAQGPDLEIGDLTAGQFTRLILQVTDDGRVRLLNVLAGDYIVNDFNGLGDNEQVAVLEGAAGAVDAVRVYTSGGLEGAVGINALAVFAAPPSTQPKGGLQLPGDCNGDGIINIADPVCLLRRLFLGQPQPQQPCGDGSLNDPGNIILLDSAGGGTVDLSDAIRVLQFLFLGGPPHILGEECVEIPGCPSAEHCL